METFLTKTMTIVALTCFLVVGAAATAIIGRDSIPAPRLELASASLSAVQGPVSNREVKQDRLAVSYAVEPSEPRQIDPALNESLRRAYASTSPADIGMPKEIAAPNAPSTTATVAPAKPKIVNNVRISARIRLFIMSLGKRSEIKLIIGPRRRKRVHQWLP